MILDISDSETEDEAEDETEAETDLLTDEGLEDEELVFFELFRFCDLLTFLLCDEFTVGVFNEYDSVCFICFSIFNKTCIVRITTINPVQKIKG